MTDKLVRGRAEIRVKLCHFAENLYRAKVYSEVEIPQLNQLIMLILIAQSPFLLTPTSNRTFVPRDRSCRFPRYP